MRGVFPPQRSQLKRLSDADFDRICAQPESPVPNLHAAATGVVPAKLSVNALAERTQQMFAVLEAAGPSALGTQKPEELDHFRNFAKLWCEELATCGDVSTACRAAVEKTLAPAHKQMAEVHEGMRTPMLRGLLKRVLNAAIKKSSVTSTKKVVTNLESVYGIQVTPKQRRSLARVVDHTNASGIAAMKAAFEAAISGRKYDPEIIQALIGGMVQDIQRGVEKYQQHVSELAAAAPVEGPRGFKKLLETLGI